MPECAFQIRQLTLCRPLLEKLESESSCKYLGWMVSEESGIPSI